MKGPEEKIAVVGVGQTHYSPTTNQALEEMIFEAASNALAHAGLERTEIDNVVIVASDEWDGRAISSMLGACPAGAYLKDEIKVTDGGIYGLVLAWMRLSSGVFNTSLLVSWTKPSEAPARSVETLQFEPFFSRAIGLSGPAALALEASRYLALSGASEEDGARVLVKNRLNGASNPHCEHKQKISMEEAMSANYIATPLRRGWLPPLTDGACALVLTGERRARELRKNPAYVSGLGWSIGEYFGGDRELGRLQAARTAAELAYRMAAIRNPAEEVDGVELSDVTPFHELMLYEALGLCAPGEGKEFLRSGASERHGRLPVNRSGGLLCANLPVAGSLVRAAEAALQVMGEAGPHQSEKIERTLAQGFTGPFSQGSCCVIFSKDAEL
jgi:acetyl-CoA C-acetyltransferase